MSRAAQMKIREIFSLFTRSDYFKEFLLHISFTHPGYFSKWIDTKPDNYDDSPV